jgi:flagellin-like hook-associated protein FlgL
VIGIGSGGKPVQYLRNYHDSIDRSQTAIERLSTGKRINRPSDDPSGFITAEQLRGEIAKFKSELNKLAGDRSATHLEQSGLMQIADQLIELKGAIAGAAGGLLTAEQREAFNQDIDGVMEAIERTRQLYDGLSSKKLDRLDSSARKFDNLASTKLEAAAGVADARIDEATFSAAALAAHEKYDIDLREEQLQNQIATHTEALSQVEDADFAEEASALAAAQITSQGSLAALAVSNKMSADQIGALMDGVRENADAPQE